MLSVRALPSRHALLAILCCLGLAAQPPARAAPAPIEAFFESSPFGGALLSPDAKYLAVKSGAPGRHDFLVVIDLDSNTAKVAASFNDADVAHFEWVNNERLVFNVTDKLLGPGDTRYGGGLFAVNRDGERLLQLADRRGSYFVTEASTPASRKILPWHTYMLEQRGAQDSEFIYVASAEFDTGGQVRYVNLLRLNTLSGRTQTVPRPGPVRSWMLDNKGEPRLAIASERNTTTIYYRDPASSEWRTLASYAAFGESRDAIVPVAFGPDGTLYVAAGNGKDTGSLYTFNLATGKISPEPVVVTAGYDFTGSLLTTQDKVLGVRFTTDAVASEWFDPGMKAVQAQVDKALPATVNLISVAARAQSPWVLVRSYSDVIPPNYSLFNVKTGLVNKVGDSRPHVDSRQMGRQQAVRYKARDGLEIPALLTLPRTGAGKNLPLVVLVHGGPYVRGSSWGWHPESQFLASRGYAVLEPEYRGSTGFGAKHFKAGWKQWGLGMQNDIADGARWAIAQGIVDPKRICIAGASYGGYATLMGLVNDPDLYQCGIDWSGVTDINLLYNGSWSFQSDLSEQYKEYGMPELVGNQVKDAAQLKATSPIEQAARITQPVLLAYGGVDRRVPIYHGKKFYDAVTRTNHKVEWIEYPEEGHGWALPKNNIDFWSRVEKFLDKNIGKGAVQE